MTTKNVKPAQRCPPRQGGPLTEKDVPFRHLIMKGLPDSKATDSSGAAGGDEESRCWPRVSQHDRERRLRGGIYGPAVKAVRSVAKHWLLVELSTLFPGSQSEGSPARELGPASVRFQIPFFMGVAAAQTTASPSP